MAVGKVVGVFDKGGGAVGPDELVGDSGVGYYDIRFEFLKMG